MNNRKQQINSLLDSLTVKELEDYLNNHKINKDNEKQLQLLKLHNENKNNVNHQQKLANEIYNNIGDLYTLGEADIIANIMYYGLHKEFKIKDFINVYDDMLNQNPKLKEYVYEIMKDLK